MTHKLVPVEPMEITPDCTRRYVAYAEGWNACRSAMLNAAPQPEQEPVYLIWDVITLSWREATKDKFLREDAKNRWMLYPHPAECERCESFKERGDNWKSVHEADEVRYKQAETKLATLEAENRQQAERIRELEGERNQLCESLLESSEEWKKLDAENDDLKADKQRAEKVIEKCRKHLTRTNKTSGYRDGEQQLLDELNAIVEYRKEQGK